MNNGIYAPAVNEFDYQPPEHRVELVKCFVFFFSFPVALDYSFCAEISIIFLISDIV
jgi:hypothetical protein